MLDKNEFGALVKAYRQQRGWTQSELAERWGHTQGYISQIEKGQRKIDSTDQLVRLADLLDIPQEKLDAIGRGIPERKIGLSIRVWEGDNMLQMLLAPGKEMVRLAYLVWQADQHPVFEESLRNLIFNLNQALPAYQGEFRKPAQQLLAYAHQMRGKIAVDRLDLGAASGHFSVMIELGNELHDADIVTIGMSNQANMLKKRGQLEAAIRCFKAAKPHADAASRHVQGIYHMLMSRSFYDSGDKEGFLSASNVALEIASGLKEDIASLANEFSLDDVLCEQGSGFTELGEPKKALEIYQEAERLRPNRLLREKGSFVITRAQAYLQALELNPGVEEALLGIQLASEYQSRRHIEWIEKAYRRLPEHIKADKQLKPLREALRETAQKQEKWF